MYINHWGISVQLQHVLCTSCLLGGISLLHGEGSVHGLGSTVGDHDISHGLITAVSLGTLHLTHDVHALDDLAEDDVTSVQPGGLLYGDEELAAVGVLAGVGHRQPSSSVVLQLEVLVLETLSVDRAAWKRRRELLLFFVLFEYLLYIVRRRRIEVMINELVIITTKDYMSDKEKTLSVVVVLSENKF